MHFLLTTLGCKVNQYEGRGLSAELVKLGFVPAPSAETADIFVLNSCTVTENADKKTRRFINSVRAKNPNAVVVLAGCFPQAFPERAQELGADLICGTAGKNELPALIGEYVKNKNRAELKEKPWKYEEFSGFNPGGGTRAFIKIQDGCDCNCTYCVVPRARGVPRSRSHEDFIKEVKAASEAGFKEIVLAGINLTKHIDLYGAVSAAAEYVRRVRLSSVEPDLLTDELLEKLAGIKNLCPHFHLSLQSGSDGVLKRMDRRYTAYEYLEKVEKIRSLFGADCAFTTDMMTGFPGETNVEFDESLAFARKIGFLKIHVFPFSARLGTEAAGMKAQIPEKIKLERRNILLSAAEELRRDYLKAQIGKKLDVLIEKRINNDAVFGYVENYAPVKIIDKTCHKNEILNVKIIAAEKDVLSAEE